MNVVNILRRAAAKEPGKVALRCNGVELTFADVMDRAGRLASYLTADGMQPGDRVALYSPNSIDWLPTWTGVLQAGGTVVPINTLASPSALRHILTDAGVRWLIVRAEDLTRVAEMIAALESAVALLSIEPAEGARTSLAELPAADHVPVTPRLDTDDAMIMYTSGSTGTPKGARQTHRNTSAQCEAVQQVFEITSSDHALVCTPLFHVGGLQLISLPLLFAGGTVTLMLRWNQDEWVQLSAKLEPSICALVPTMMIDIANAHADSEATELPSYRICMIGGSALPDGPLQRFAKATGITCVRNIYGQTEQSGLCATEPSNDDRRPRTMGRPLDQIVRWQVVELGESSPLRLGSGTPGELWVRGDAVTPGYWNNPAGTEDRFVDGWFRTGDLVRADEDGYLYFVERADDMIISGGENVFPQMIENHLLSSPLVAEVAVIPTPHERYVQQVTAIVVPTGPDTTPEDLEEWCRGHPDLQGLQRPRRFEIVDELPRTANSKIDRMTLKKRFSE